MSVNNIAETVKNIGEDVKIIRSVTNDNRSYHISSEKLKKSLILKLNLQLMML